MWEGIAVKEFFISQCDQEAQYVTIFLHEDQDHLYMYENSLFCRLEPTHMSLKLP